MNALANEQVGAFVNQHCVATYVKVGTFAVLDSKKRGGNVATYFCLPDGRVLHALAGPVDANTFLYEARWVVNLRNAAVLDASRDPARCQGFVQRAHAERLERDFGVTRARVQQVHAAAVKLPSDEGRGPVGERQDTLSLGKLQAVENQAKLGNAGRVHLLLALFPLVNIADIYQYVFEKILNQEVSLLPVLVE